MSGKKHLYKSAGSFEINDVPSLSPNVAAGNTMPRRNPPQIIPFPIFEAELSDPDLSPNKEKTSTNAATKEIVKNVQSHSPPTVKGPVQELDYNQEVFNNKDKVVKDILPDAPKKRVKKVGRIVPSRYKTAASSFKKPSNQSLNIVGDLTKPLTKADKRPPPPTPLQQNMSINRSTKPAVATSTPAVSVNKPRGNFDQSFPTDMSLISGKSFVKSKTSNKKMNKTRYLEHRLLQAAFLDVLSYKTLEEQEIAAQNQLYSLWKAVEDAKKEIAELERAIANEELKTVLDKTLDTQLNGLVPLSELMIKTHGPIRTMSAALDTTRHDVFLRNINPTNEDELKALLNDTETILADCIPYIRDDVETVSDLCGVHDELLMTAEKEFNEIERTWKKLSSVTKLQLQQTSLYHEEIQRKDNQ